MQMTGTTAGAAFSVTINGPLSLCQPNGAFSVSITVVARLFMHLYLCMQETFKHARLPRL
jgi:hypothetical protein